MTHSKFLLTAQGTRASLLSAPPPPCTLAPLGLRPPSPLSFRPRMADQHPTPGSLAFQSL